MVALYNFDDEYGQNPRTVGDWVKNFRMKKMQMKRKLRTSGGGLRVCAILSTALNTAEMELRRKQQERFQKWLEFQSKIRNHELQTRSEQESHHHYNRPTQGNEMILVACDDDSETKRCKQSEEITKLWKCELSELDNFMRSISSSSNSRNSTTTNVTKNNENGKGCRLSAEEVHRSQPLSSHQQSIQVTTS